MFPSWHHGTPASFYLFSLAGADGAEETEMFPSLGQREQPSKTRAQGRPWHRDRMSWHDRPESGPPPGFHRGLELTSGSKTLSIRGQAEPMPPPGGWFRRARRGQVYGNPHLGGGCRRTLSPASDKSLGKSSQRSLGKHPRLRRILKQKLHSTMEGRRGSWGGGAPAPVDIKPKDPERDPRLNMGQTCELKAARRNWPATELPVVGSSRSRSEG